MKLKITTILILFLSIISLIIFNKDAFTLTTSAVKKFGDLTVIYQHSPLNGPIFSVPNAAPGDIQTRELSIINTGSHTEKISIKGILLNKKRQKALEKNLLIQIIDITDKKAKILYGEKNKESLYNFFDVSDRRNGVILNSIKKNETRKYRINLFLKKSAGNEVQNKNISFDLAFGSAN